MRSEFRCSEHFQGDYCTKVDGHEDRVHSGKHVTWVIQDDGNPVTWVLGKITAGDKEEFNSAVRILAGV